MTNKTLVRLIQDHLEQIATCALRNIRQDQHLVQVRRLPEWEVRDWAMRILRDFVEWPVQVGDQELSARAEALGRQRFQESIPLHEWIRRIQHLKWALVNWVRDQSCPQNASDLYAQEEFEHYLSLFFDHLMFYVARGYEEARQSAQPLAHGVR